MSHPESRSPELAALLPKTRLPLPRVRRLQLSCSISAWTKFFSIDLCVVKIIFAVHHDRLLRFFIVNFLLEFAGNAHPQRVWLNHSTFRYHGAGGDDAAFADLCIVQDYAAHADE